MRGSSSGPQVSCFLSHQSQLHRRILSCCSAHGREDAILVPHEGDWLIEFNDLPCIQDEDAINIDDGIQSVSDRQDRALGERCPDRLLDLCIRSEGIN